MADLRKTHALAGEPARQPGSAETPCPQSSALERPPRPWPQRAPRPWREAEPERLASLRGVLTDIDDTLTRQGQIEPAALAALGALAAARVPVIAITGRPAGWCEARALDWPLTAIVAESGAVLLRRGAAGFERAFAQDEATRRAHAQRLQACAAEILRCVPEARLAEDSPGRLTDIAIDHSEFHPLPPAAQARVLALMRAHGLRATLSSIHLNGWLGEHDKASGAAWAVAQCLGMAFEPADWLFVGDSPNDQALFARVPVSVGVANLAPHLPQLSPPPAFITEAERGAGFAEVAAKILASRP